MLFQQAYLMGIEWLLAIFYYISQSTIIVHKVFEGRWYVSLFLFLTATW